MAEVDNELKLYVKEEIERIKEKIEKSIESSSEKTEKQVEKARNTNIAFILAVGAFVALLTYLKLNDVIDSHMGKTFGEEGVQKMVASLKEKDSSATLIIKEMEISKSDQAQAVNEYKNQLRNIGIKNCEWTAYLQKWELEIERSCGDNKVMKAIRYKHPKGQNYVSDESVQIECCDLF